jgi:hypothetical protein
VRDCLHLLRGSDTDAVHRHLSGAIIKTIGLHALGEIDDIVIAAGPDTWPLDSLDEQLATASLIIQHSESLNYRLAIIDGLQGVLDQLYRQLSRERR